MKDHFFNKIKAPLFLEEYFEEADWYLMIGKFKKILEESIKDNSDNIKKSTVKCSGKIQIGKNLNIGDFVVIEGPVYIGDNVEICPGAYIRPGSVIGDRCSIGHAAEVKNALMMDGAKIANHTFLGDSIMGAKARLGGHSETANRRFDQKNIDFVFKDHKLETGLDKLGVIIGEESRLGGGVFTSPGAMVGKKTFIDTGVVVKDYIPKDSYVKKVVDYEIRENRFQGELHNESRFMD